MKKLINLGIAIAIFMLLAIGLVSAITWENPNYYIKLSSEANLNVNSSDYWDNLNTPSDITGSEFWYNHTIPSVAYTDGIITLYNGTWSTTYNASYQNGVVWQYNQTVPAEDYVDTIVTNNNGSWSATYNSSYDSGIIWQYNQTTPAEVYGDATFSPIVWAYNQTTAVFNSWGEWFYNMTTPSVTYTDVHIDNFTAHNSTFWYNQTEPAIDYSDSTFYNKSANIDGDAYNVTADYFKGDVQVGYLDEESYTTLQDWIDTTQSAGLLSGGNISGDVESGTINVTAGTGFVKTSDDIFADTIFFEWDATDNIAVNTDNNTKFTVYVDYNSGTPIVSAKTGSLTFTTQFSIGSVVWEVKQNTTDDEHRHLHILNNAGTRVYNLARRTQQALREPGFSYTSGAILGSSGLNITLTEGVFYAGLDRITTSSFDSSSTDYESYYYNGSNWIQGCANQIDNTYYNDITSGLTELTANRYGVHWIYIEVEGDVNVLYGQDDYTLAGAEASSPPSSVPGFLNYYGILAGRIVVQKSATSLTETSSAFDTIFSATATSDHGELAGLSDDDHTQYLLADGTRELSANWNVGTWNITASWFKGFLNWSNVVNFPYEEWMYNMTTPAISYVDGLGWQSTYNVTYAGLIKWGYNQTTPAIAYVGSRGWNSTYNSTYAIWAYNETTIAEAYADLTFADFNYNMTPPAILYANAQGWNSTYNSSYALWAYNQTVIGDTTWDYNQTTPAETYSDGKLAEVNTTANIQGLLNATDIYSTYNVSYLSIYNATYTIWGYNMTTEANSYADTTYADFNYNMTTPAIAYSAPVVWGYNQTTPAESYADATFLPLDGTGAMTGNLDVNENNLTDVSYIKFKKIAGSCDLTINGSICSNASGTYIVG